MRAEITALPTEGTHTSHLLALVALARPRQWVKNIIVLAPLPLAKRMADPQAWAAAILALVAFCLASSGMYVMNDIADRERDRLHPRKRFRPLASGRVGIWPARTEAALLVSASGVLALSLGRGALILIAAYVTLQVAYSATLKNAILVDVI